MLKWKQEGPLENRDTFFDRFRRPPGSVLLSAEDIDRIELAYALAKYAHRAQDRKDGERYFEHPRRVALWLIDGVGLYDPASIIAALLHDAYEDAPQYVTPAKVRIVGGAEAERMIRLLSKMPKDGYLERLRAHGDWKTLLIKLCDRHDNMSSLSAAPADFQRKQTVETRDTYLPLFDHLLAIAPAPYRGAIEEIVEKVRFSVMKWSEALGLDTPSP